MWHDNCCTYEHTENSLVARVVCKSHIHSHILHIHCNLLQLISITVMLVRKINNNICLYVCECMCVFVVLNVINYANRNVINAAVTRKPSAVRTAGKYTHTYLCISASCLTCISGNMHITVFKCSFTYMQCCSCS